MTQTETSPNGRTLADIVSITEGPAPKRAAPVPRRYRWIPIPENDEFGYQGWEIKMWTNFPANLVTIINSGDPEKRKAAFYQIFIEHNGWQYEGLPEIPQPGAQLAEGEDDFLEAIPQEVGNFLAVLLGAEQKALSFLVTERRPTSRRS